MITPTNMQGNFFREFSRFEVENNTSLEDMSGLNQELTITGNMETLGRTGRDPPWRNVVYFFRGFPKDPPRESLQQFISDGNLSTLKDRLQKQKMKHVSITTPHEISPKRFVYFDPVNLTDRNVTRRTANYSFLPSFCFL